VDGIFTNDPKKCPDAKLINRLFAKELLTMERRTSVDKFLPKLLLQFQIECFVVSGLSPERIDAILNKRETVCTSID
jgi:5-(aminomethyl)-3-furanmethanol phosphate kinase